MFVWKCWVFISDQSMPAVTGLITLCSWNRLILFKNIQSGLEYNSLAILLWKWDNLADNRLVFQCNKNEKYSVLIVYQNVYFYIIILSCVCVHFFTTISQRSLWERVSLDPKGCAMYTHVRSNEDLPLSDTNKSETNIFKILLLWIIVKSYC